MSSSTPTAPRADASPPIPPRALLRSPVARARRLWEAYMTPGRPGRPTTQQELRWIYTAWLVGFLLKMLGSSWDVSWHFRWLRDDLAPPHLLNSAGTVLVAALVVFHSYTGYGVDRRALRLLQWGIGTFLVAIPLDILNHRINGLDITSWSPTHALLYLGTAIMLAGALRGWWLYAAPGRVRNLVSLGLWLLFVENVLFPNQHQEYGYLSLIDYRAGHTTAEPSLLDFAAAQGQSPEQFMLPVPSWVHPAWLICAGVLTLVVARRAVGLRWTATALTGAYLAYRAVVWVLLVATGFPPSVPPVMLLAGAVLVDLAVTRRIPGWLAALAVAAGVVLAALLQDALAVIPPWQWTATPVIAVAFALLWAGLDRFRGSAAFARWRLADAGPNSASGGVPSPANGPAQPVGRTARQAGEPGPAIPMT